MLLGSTQFVWGKFFQAWKEKTVGDGCEDLKVWTSSSWNTSCSGKHDSPTPSPLPKWHVCVCFFNTDALFRFNKGMVFFVPSQKIPHIKVTNQRPARQQLTGCRSRLRRLKKKTSPSFWVQWDGSLHSSKVVGCGEFFFSLRISGT